MANEPPSDPPPPSTSLRDIPSEGRLDALHAVVGTLANEVAWLKRKHEELEAHLGKTRDFALGAHRAADRSIHEFEQMTSGIVAHLARIEAARAESDQARNVAIDEIRTSLARGEAARKEATTQHAERFRLQGDAINQIAKAVGGDRRLRLWGFVVIPIIVVALGQAVELTKFIVALRYQYTPTQRIELPQ